MLTTTLPIEIYINVSGLGGSHTSYLHSFSLKSPSTQTSSYHQFYSFIMEKSSNHQLLNGKISISSFPKFSISTAFKAQIHQIITKFKPNLQSTGNPNPPHKECILSIFRLGTSVNTCSSFFVVQESRSLEPPPTKKNLHQSIMLNIRFQSQTLDF